MEEIRFKRQQLLSSKKKTAMYKRNMKMFTSMEKKLSEAYIIFARNVPEYKLKLNLLEQVLGEVDKEVFEENKIELFEGKDDEEVETIIVEPDLIGYIAECQLGGTETIEPTTVKIVMDIENKDKVNDFKNFKSIKKGSMENEC